MQRRVIFMKIEDYEDLINELPFPYSCVKMIFNNKKALIVDDCQSWLDILSNLINSFGLEVDTVNSGENAIELLKQNKDK